MTEIQRVDRQVVVGSINSHGSSPDGGAAILDLNDQAGERYLLIVPTGVQAQFVMTYQASCLAAASLRKTPAAPEVLSAVNAKETRLGIGPTGKVSLFLALRTGPELTFPISRSGLEAMLKAGHEALEYLDRGGSPEAQ